MNRPSLKKLIFALLPAIFVAGMLLPVRPEGMTVPESFSWSGGSGRVEISCEEVEVGRDIVTARIVFSSPNYTYVKVKGVKYEGDYTEDTSTFNIPLEPDMDNVVIGCTTAMSTPHEVEYVLRFSLKGSGASDNGSSAEEAGNTETSASYMMIGKDEEPIKCPGLTFDHSLEKKHAEGFDIFYYEEGYKSISVTDGRNYLIVPSGKDVPEGLPSGVSVIKGRDNIYLAATGAMSLFHALDAMDKVKFTGTEKNGWYIDPPKEALEKGEMVYAGKYSAPDFEFLISRGCDLAVESTMIYHCPEIKEQFENLGIPVFIDCGSYENTAEGKMEWIYVYAAMVDKEEKAEEYLTSALSKYPEEKTDLKGDRKKVAFFHINNANLAVIRRDEDYITGLISDGGGDNAFSDIEKPGDSANVKISLESFLDAALDADYIIYNGTLDPSVNSLDDLKGKGEYMTALKAVNDGNVFLLNREFYQSTDRLMILSGDVRTMIENGSDDSFTFLRRLK